MAKRILKVFWTSNLLAEQNVRLRMQLTILKTLQRRDSGRGLGIYENLWTDFFFLFLPLSIFMSIVRGTKLYLSWYVFSY